MRSPHCFSAVVRRKSGALVVREMPMADLRRGKLAWPLVRGVAALVEALKLGSAALRFSAEQFEQDLEEEGGGPKSGPRSAGPSMLSLVSLPIIALLTNAPEDFGKGPQPAAGPGDGKKRLLGVLSAVFAIGMFVALPQAFAAVHTARSSSSSSTRARCRALGSVLRMPRTRGGK